MLVDFMLIGAQKCGTTKLAGQLANHPSICFCREKEPGYFNAVDDWRMNLSAYHDLYSPIGDQICGEGSTMYTFLPEYRDTHLRLYEYNPNLKFLYIMRQPVERVMSNYAHRLVRGTVKTRPDHAVFATPDYLNRTRYAVQIRPYIERFGRENVLLLIFEEYIANPIATLDQIADFLGVASEGFRDASSAPSVVHSSVGEYHWGGTLAKFRSASIVDRMAAAIPAAIRTRARRALGRKLESKPVFSPELRQLIWRFVEDDVAYIEAQMGRRLHIWREGYTE